MNLLGLKALLALAPQTQPGTVPDPKAQLLQMLGMFLFLGIMFYFAVIRPPQKRARELAVLLQNLKPGDRILTNSGILATVVNVKEKTLSIRSADSKLEILKSAVSEITEKAGAAES